jgi:hypothetical protein
MEHFRYPIEYINIKSYLIVRKIIHTVLHIDYEHVYTTAYLRIRVTRIHVSRGLTVLNFLTVASLAAIFELKCVCTLYASYSNCIENTSLRNSPLARQTALKGVGVDL